jgi:hypothetical protein
MIEAAVATEKPARVKIKASVMEAKPVLTPDGNTKKKKATGFVEPDWCTVLVLPLETLSEQFRNEYDLM